MGFMTPWGEYMRALCARMDKTEQEVAESFGISKGNLSGMITGSRPVPAKHVDKWCETLLLDEKQKPLFEELAALTHIPIRFQKLFADRFRRLSDIEEALRRTQDHLEPH